VRRFLADLEKSALVELIIDRAEIDPVFLHALSLEKSKHQGRAPDVAGLRRLISDAFAAQDLPSYEEEPRDAPNLHAILDTLSQLLKRGHAQAVVELAEYALEIGQESLEQFDDWEGELGDVLDHLKQLHLAACAAAHTDPEALARRLFTWELQSEGEVFLGAVETYAEVLGKAGMAAHRELAETAWRDLPASIFAPQERRPTSRPLPSPYQDRPRAGARRTQATSPIRASPRSRERGRSTRCG
jgi:hypothetical protein